MKSAVTPNPDSKVVFDEDRASTYDQRAARIAPLRDALHLLTRLQLSGLRADARILCVGVGTGLELIYLAREFPLWQFVAVEPAAPMLDICRQKAEASGVASRCTWHEGYLDTMPPAEPFDAATCFLVSHFFMQPDARRDFFSQIAARLGSGGCLVTADLASDMASAAYQSLRHTWASMLKFAEYPEEDIDKFLASQGRDVAVLPPNEVAALIKSAGFEAPVQFMQTLFIHAWSAERR